MFTSRFFLLSCLLTLSVMPLACMIHNDSAFFSTEQLFECVKTGEDADLIDTFIKHGGDIFAMNDAGQTPLEIARNEQAYWKKQQPGLLFKKEEIQKRYRNYLCIVKKLQYAEQQTKRTLITKPNNPFEILCICAAEKKLLFDEENRQDQTPIQKPAATKRFTSIEKPISAERLLLHKTLQDSQDTLLYKETVQETKKIDIETDSQDALLVNDSEKKLNKPLKRLIHLTIAIPEKPNNELIYLQAH